MGWRRKLIRGGVHRSCSSDLIIVSCIGRYALKYSFCRKQLHVTLKSLGGCNYVTPPII